jgi:hypothetical protein
VEALPPELAGVADRVTVILPWGSLLAAVARPEPEALRAVRALCQPRAELTVVLGIDAARDGAEARRLDLPALDAAYLAGPLAVAYGEAGFAVERVRRLMPGALGAWPSTWARRLAHGHGRDVFQIGARVLP